MTEELTTLNEQTTVDEQDVAIKITGLKKRYRLGLITAGTLRGDLQSWWARVRGKEDPNLKIGAKVHSKNEVFMALDGIDLTIYKGERVGIIGHNGAGKSTLLKLLARVTGPTEGEIKLDGRITSMLEVGTGFNGELTGRENVYLNGAILGMTKAEVDRKMDQIIEFSECRQFIDTPVKRYSSGMFVKLAFSVAAHLDSEIMIMDEVLAVGDMAFQKKCLDKMNEVSKDEGRTILYVSHNMNTIRQLCSRVIVLSHGKVIFNGDVEEGIAIYLQNEKYEDVVSLNLDEVKRDRAYLGKDAKLTFFEFVGKKKAVFKIGEPIKMRVKWRCNTESVNYRIIMPIKNDIGITVGSAVTEPLNDGNENLLHEENFEVSTDQLVSGDYSFILAIYGIDDMGNEYMCDHSIVKIRFSIAQDDTSAKWKKNFWGNIRFDVKKD